jgi:hypothetical protein
MALSFVYDVIRADGTGYKNFRNQKKAETYAASLKRTPEEKIQITRTGKGFAPYVYYV